jgi:hypothetical protein
MLKKLGFLNANAPLRMAAPLDTVLSGMVLELDATIQDSYPGSGQTWFNLTTAPVGGAAKAVYNFTLGTTPSVSGDDATFVGPAGDSAAYWSLDGSDAFRAQSTLYEYPGGLSTMPGGPDFTVIAALRMQHAPSEQRIFATQGNSAFSRGLSIAIDWTDQLYVGQYGDTQATAAFHTPAMIPGNDYLCIVACEKATNKARFWLNNRIGTERDFAMDASSNNAVNYSTIGARTSGGADFLVSGTRLYHISLRDGAIGDSEAAQIFNLLNARHGRFYG